MNSKATILTFSDFAGRRSFGGVTWIIVSLVGFASLAGCKTFEPFNQSMRTRVAAARRWTGNGLEAIKRGSLREARDCFNRASSQLPDDHRIVANVARTHSQEGQTELAIDVMKQAIELAPNDAALRAELGEFYLANGNSQLAFEAANQSLDLNRRLASAWLLKGKINTANGLFENALSDFQRAAGIEHDREDIQLQIVRTYQQLNQPLRALSAAEQMLQKYPVDRQPEELILAKSSALQKLKQVTPAIELLQTAANRKDASSEMFIQLARAQEAAGRSSAAFQTLVKAKERFPDQSEIAFLVDQMQSQNQSIASLR